MANQLRQQIEQISREKNINPEVIIAAIEDAILTASKKYYKGAEDLRSRFNDESGLIEVFAVKQIVETVEIPETQISLDEAQKIIPEAEVGQEIEFPKPTDVLGRIAAQTAKQVIFQKVREAERDNVFAEYSGRVGEVVNGIIKRQEMGDFVVDLGRAEAVLPRKEQSRAETYQTGDRVRVAITKVLKSAKGPQVVVSRTDPALLIKLFEMEVPEIYDGTVQIRGCVREAGERAKVAVISRERDVDPVGACVGMKGTRVQSIIRELRGEKIDIVEWNDDPATFVVNALSPAKVSRVSILDDEQKIMEVVVEDKQLSLAIGKKGQNVRLAAKIVGWRIDIKSEEEKRQEVEAEMARMARIVDELRSLEAHGVGDKVVQKLIDSGIAGLAHVLEMSDEDLTSLEGIGPKTAEKVREAATLAKAEWDARDAAWEAERVEAERVAAEEAAEAERLAAAEAAEAEQQAAAEAEGAEAEEPAAEGTEAALSSDAPAEVAAEPAADGASAAVSGEEGRRMVNVRVFNLARDLGISSQEVIDRLKKLGVEVKTASSSIDEDTADKLKRALKIDALTARKKRVYGSEEEEVEREVQERLLAEKIEAERAERERAAAEAKAAAESRKHARARGGAKVDDKATGAKAVAVEEAPPVLAHAPGAPRLAPKVTAPPPAPLLDEEASEEFESEPAEEAAPAPAPAAAASSPAVAAPPAPPVRTTVVPRATGPVRPIAPVTPTPAVTAAPAAAPQAAAPTPTPAASAVSPAPSRPIAPLAPRQVRPIAPPRPVGPHPTSPHPVSGQGALPRSPHMVSSGAPRPAGMGLRPMSPIPSRPAPAPAPRPAGRPAPKSKDRGRPQIPPPPKDDRPVYTGPPRKIALSEGVTVKELSEKMADVKSRDIMKALISRGIMATVNQSLEPALAIEICKEFAYEAEIQSFEQELSQVQTVESKPEDLEPRAPVITVMGHVDHGKTSLLDAIRETQVAAGEAGGITQHIGAYHVDVGKRKVVFLDTPGHEAFTLMRARGAKVTDIVVLVVAADDGVMPQTLEAIDHAKAAGVPIVVAVNKIDKAEAQPDRVKQQLSDRGLMPEEWGGTTVFVNVSAKKRQNLEQLLEMLLLVADLQELKANSKKPALGTVLEARLDKGRGPVATVLVQDGTLSVGDTVVAGAVAGKVRALNDDRGNRLQSAGPSTPVEILGLQSLPEPGDPLLGVTDNLKAQSIVAFRQLKLREKAMASTSKIRLEDLGRAIAEGQLKELPLVLKADVQGSLEAVADQLAKLPQEKIKLRIIRQGAGAITEGDVLLAAASNAVVIGFNVRPERKATEIAERDKVEIRLYTVIYDAVEEMRKALEGLLEPSIREVRLGSAEVRDVFKISKVGTIAGCFVVDGRVNRSAQIRLLRDNVVIHTGKVSSLKRFKDDASEVKAGSECGIGIANYNDLKPGDVIEFFTTEKVKETLE